MSRLLNNLLCGAAVLSSALSFAFPFGGEVAEANADTKPTTDRVFRSLERSYLENKGQFHRNALMLTRSEGLDFWVTRTGFVLDAYRNVKRGANPLTETAGMASIRPDFREGQAVMFDFVGSRGTSSYVGADPLATRIEYVNLGGRTIKDVKAYAEATVNGVLPGVGLRVYRDGDKPRYDVLVAPGVDAESISMRVRGADDMVVDKEGRLNILTSLGWLHKADLMVYQQGPRGRTPVAAQFAIEEGKDGYYVRFDLGAYDKTRALVIDPIVYGTHFGGDFADDEVAQATSDGAGNTFFTGWTTSIDLPIVAGPYGVELKDSFDGFMAQLTGDIYDAQYIAFVGTGFNDWGKFVQVDQYGNVWMAGSTLASRFPGRLDVTVGVPEGALAPWGGTFAFTYAGIQTDPIPYNARAGDIQTALNALANAPVGGFTVTAVDANGNLLNQATARLPVARMRIVSTDPAAGALRIVIGRRPYVVNSDPAGAASDDTQLLSVDFTAFGFSPRAGTFTLGLVENATTTQSAGIRFDANGTEVQTGLRTIPALAGDPPNARVTAAGLRLVNTAPEPVNSGNTVTISFFTPPAPQVRPLLVPNTAGVDYGTYAFLNAAPHAFLTLFRKTPTGITAADDNPAVPAVSRMIRGVTTPVLNPAPLPIPTVLDNSITGLALRRISTATGLVEIAIAGNAAGQISVITGDGAGAPTNLTGAPPTGARFGYLTVFTYNQTTGAITFDNTRSRYIGGTGRTTVDGVAMDAEGAVYLAGGVEQLLPSGFATNASLTAASPIFAVTAGGYPNSTLLRFKDAWFRKYSPAGALLISSVLGGSQYDKAEGIAVDLSNNIYLLTRTNSFNYPRTVNSFSEIFPGGGTLLAVTKINSTGSTIVYSTSLAASVRSVDDVTPPLIPAPNSRFDQFDIAVDQRGNAYITGVVTRPLTGPIPMQLTPVAPAIADQLPALDNVMPNGDTEGFLTVLNSTGTGLLYSSVIGESASAEYATGVSVDRTGAVYVTGGSIVTAIGPIGLPGNYLSTFGFKLFSDGFDGWLTKLKVVQPILVGMVVNPVDVAGGLGATAQVQVLLQRPAPLGGASVTLRISNPSVARFNNAQTGPTNIRVTIPEGQQQFSAPVTVFTRLVSNPTFVDIRAELDGDFQQARLNVRPWMNSFQLGTTSIAGGESVNGTVTIFQNAPATGIDVTLTSDSPLVTFPGGNTVTIPAGQRSITFEVATSGVDINTDVNVTASVAGVGITQTLQLTPPLLDTINISPDRVTGGEATTATVQVQGVAGPNTQVTISATGPALSIIRPGETVPVSLPTTVQIPQGLGEVSFAIVTPFVASNTSSLVTASLNGESASDTLFIENNEILSITLSNSTVTGGALVTGQVNIQRPAGLTGMSIPLTNSNPTAGTITPTTVTIAPGATSGSFQIQTNPSANLETLTVATNKPGGYTNRSATLTINPLVINFTLSITPPSLTGGAGAVGTIQLAAAAPIALTFNLSSSNPLAFFPGGNTVTIPAGQTSRTFNISTGVTNATTVVNIGAELFGTTVTRQLTVFPPAIISFFVSPNVVTALNSTTGFITLDQAAPAGGLTVNLSAITNSGFVSMPSSVIVPAGATTATFPINTFQVTRQLSVQIRASVPARGQTIDALLTINPRP